jgi:putative acetyltransferase
MSDVPAIVIRRAETRDAEALCTVYSSPQAMAGTLQLPYPGVEMWRKRLAEFPADDYMLVAEVRGEVVANAGLHSMGRSARRRHVGYLGMAVRDDWHRKGVGTALMAAIVEVADGWLDYRRLELTVYTDTAAAIALYRRFGFEVEGTHRDYAFRDGGYVDAYAMARVRSASGTKEIRRKLTKTQRKRV